MSSLSEEEGEVFKVKKSSQSKRLAKRREKEREKQKRDERSDGDDINYDNNGYEVRWIVHCLSEQHYSIQYY